MTTVALHVEATGGTVVVVVTTAVAPAVVAVEATAVAPAVVAGEATVVVAPCRASSHLSGTVVQQDPEPYLLARLVQPAA